MPIETSTEAGARVLIVVSGRLDFPRHSELRRIYEAHPPGTAFDVDLSAAEYLDSSALGMLLLLRRHAGDDQEGVRLLRPGPAVRRILGIANFDRLFRIVPA
jgi:HptB-dependent secretion and biofilm anti anti-sigma factor